MNLIEKCPCKKDCPERFTACADRCPKDARGEYGYKAWKEELKKIKSVEKEYKKRDYEDWLRSEEREFGQEQFNRYKNKQKSGCIYGRK